MIQRAEWRTRSDEPKTPLGVFYGRERWLRIPLWVWLLLCGFLVGVAVAFLPGTLSLSATALIPLWVGRRNYLEAPSTSGRPSLWRSTVLALTDPGALFAFSRLDAIADMVPLPAPERCFGVEMTLYRRDRVTGGDLGIVVLSEGWLVYEGRTTSFSLSPRDVLQNYSGPTAWTLCLPEKQRIAFRCYDPGWNEAMNEWIVADPPLGLSRFPPLQPNSVRRLRIPAYFQLASTNLAGVVLGIAIPALFLSTSVSWGAVGVSMSIAALLYAVGVLLERRSR